MDEENAQFTLLSDLSSSANATKTSLVWNNIDLQFLLGDMWLKYDTFKICCYAINTQSYGKGVANDEIFGNWYMSGLPFQYPYYNFATKGLTNDAMIGSAIIRGTNVYQSFYNTNIGHVFRKEQNLANIKIEVRRALDDTNTYTNNIGSSSFSFMVYPIKIYPLEKRLIPICDTASFALNTYDGTANSTRSNIVWYNIDLMVILKDLWYKYDKFKLIVGAVAYGTNTISLQYGNVNVNIAGLPFEKCDYIINGTNNSKTNYVKLFPIYFSNTASVLQLPDFTGVVFNKNQHLVNLNIFYENIITASGLSGTYPQATFIFHLVGIN